MGVSFYFGDTPINLRLLVLANTMQYMVCADHCQSYGICNAHTLATSPKFTDQTIYIIKYLSVQSLMANTVYPYAGTWEDQPEWYIIAFTNGMNKLQLIRNKK